jgi:hypothetical protein
VKARKTDAGRAAGGSSGAPRGKRPGPAQSTDIRKKEKVRAALHGVPEPPPLTLGRKNYAILGLGVVIIVAGFVALAAGSITLAPLLLVGGYAFIIPWGLLAK